MTSLTIMMHKLSKQTILSDPVIVDAMDFRNHNQQRRNGDRHVTKIKADGIKDRRCSPRASVGKNMALRR